MTYLVAVTALLGPLWAAAGGEEGFKTVKAIPFQAEKKEVPDIWVLDFTFRNPRYIMIDVPGKGRRLVWYMTYKIVNRTDQPRSFMPSFELSTDTGKTYHDSILPRAEKAVTVREDPTQPLLNSVTISRPIPPTGAEGSDVVRRGVVFWEDVDMNAKRFSVFVTGLSNGYHRVDDPMDKGKEKLLRKTLKLDFRKLGDVYNPRESEIRFEGEPTWVYR